MLVTDAMIRAWLPLIPTPAMLGRPIERIILHWTGGGPEASSYERTRYNYLVSQPNGYVVTGMHGLAAQLAPVLRPGQYAAHTYQFNGGSAGVSFCAMLGALQGRRFGRHPMHEGATRRGLAFVALLAKIHGLNPALPSQLFTHAEAWTIHQRGETNAYKWDITEVPWLPAGTNVGNWLRATCRESYDSFHLICP